MAFETLLFKHPVHIMICNLTDIIFIFPANIHLLAWPSKQLCQAKPDD